MRAISVRVCCVRAQHWRRLAAFSALLALIGCSGPSPRDNSVTARWPVGTLTATYTGSVVHSANPNYVERWDFRGRVALDIRHDGRALLVHNDFRLESYGNPAAPESYDRPIHNVWFGFVDRVDESGAFTLSLDPALKGECAGIVPPDRLQTWGRHCSDAEYDLVVECAPGTAAVESEPGVTETIEVLHCTGLRSYGLDYEPLALSRRPGLRHDVDNQRSLITFDPLVAPHP